MYLRSILLSIISEPKYYGAMLLYNSDHPITVNKGAANP